MTALTPPTRQQARADYLAQRHGFLADIKRRYEAGDTIRGIAAATGQSYSGTRHQLLEAGVTLRPRSTQAGGARYRKGSR